MFGASNPIDKNCGMTDFFYYATDAKGLGMLLTSGKVTDELVDYGNWSLWRCATSAINHWLMRATAYTEMKKAKNTDLTVDDTVDKQTEAGTASDTDVTEQTDYMKTGVYLICLKLTA
jgi:hypothetical protein